MSGAYYNEIEPYAAAWLRNLIAAGHIAPGEVDERSIADVRPDDLLGFAQCHFFAGIGVWSYALRRAGWPDDRPVWTGSCPCQPFSKAGALGGEADVRHLWPEWCRLIRECRPNHLFGEQVAVGLARGWFDGVSNDLERMDYACGAVVAPAACFGAEHIRDRLWFVAHASGARLPRPFKDGDRSSCLGQPEKLERSHVGVPARVPARTDRSSLQPIDGSARWVEPVRAYGNAINAETAAAFISASLDLMEYAA